MKKVTKNILDFCINNRDCFTTAKERYIFTIITEFFYTGEKVQNEYIKLIKEKMEASKKCYFCGNKDVKFDKGLNIWHCEECQFEYDEFKIT